MVKKENSVTRIFLLFAIFIVGMGIVVGAYLWKSLWDINHIPKGLYLHNYSSPNNEYEINIYVIHGELSITPDLVRGELVNEKTHKKSNIYYGYKESNASVAWLSNNKVSINGHVLNINKGQKYDWRSNQK